MPMYDFRCTTCEHVFEEITPSDAPPPVCPECGAVTERLITPVTGIVKRRSKKGEWHHELRKKSGAKPLK
jgi:putative FmdB family regulatory protein